MNLLEIANLTPKAAREYLEGIFWPEGPFCPHCKSVDVTRLQGKAHRDGLLQCNACREQFTVTVGTVMESSKVPLYKWCMAFHLLCSSKKGISALQLQRELGLGSYKTAWFMFHRIRHAMQPTAQVEPLKGIVEVDESYVGGKPRPHGNFNPAKRGRGTLKTPVAVLVERDGRAVCRPLQRVTAGELKGNVRIEVAKDSTIMTDQLNAYRGIGKEFSGGHRTVNHEFKQYAYRDDDGMLVTTNTAESFFALLKRGHYGVYHQMSKKHLPRYCAEYSFRWNYRKATDGERTVAAIEAAEGKRLLYETPDTKDSA